MRVLERKVKRCVTQLITQIRRAFVGFVLLLAELLKRFVRARSSTFLKDLLCEAKILQP